MTTVAIVNGTVIDGTGAPGFPATVIVENGRIRIERNQDAVRAPEGGAGADGDVERFDAAGLVVAPGIVDLHTHSDVSNLSEPHAISAIEQGVTTQVVGLCGFSAGPVSPETIATMVDEEPVFGFPGVDWSWRSIDGYLEAVNRTGVSTNTVTLVGHNTLRRFVMGGAQRAPTDAELTRMQDLIRTAFDEGARGFSTGLSYAPGTFATTDELVALTTVAAQAGKPYHTHMRYDDQGVRASVAEAIETAERSGVELNISHLYPRPSDPIDEADRYIEMIEAARGRGVRVTWDTTVFPRGGGAWVQSLPLWVLDGGMAAMQERLRDPEVRKRVRAHFEDPNFDWADDWDDQLIVKVSTTASRDLIGRTVGQIARDRGTDPLDTALDLVIEEGQYWVAPVIKRQADLDRLLSHPFGVPVTDGMASHPVMHRDLGIMPKTFGSFPQILGRYVRDAHVMSLEHAVHQMTQVPAERVAITDRGVIADDKAADLLIFDPATIANRATEGGDPAARPAGISRVMVNGTWVVRDGASTGERPGRVL